MIHTLLNVPLEGEIPEGAERILFGMGCFWGVERLYWQIDGVYRTSVGYAGGQTPEPDYKTVCTGATGHAEVVEVVYFPEQVSLKALLKIFWENHDPTQGNRQGNDIGTQYRSLIGTYTEEQFKQATESLNLFQKALSADGRGAITTDIKQELEYWLAEEYHQQYLDKNPNGYCGIKGTGTCFL